MDYNLIGVFFTAFILCVAAGPLFIPILKRLEFGQSIRDVGLQNHLKKSGTPTMGGLMMIFAIIVSVFAWCEINNAIIIALVLTLGHALIGFIDDYIKVVMKRNLGLTAKQKLLLQTLLAFSYIYYVEQHALTNLALNIPGTDYALNLGWGYYLIVFLLLVGTTNAVNLTDGLDGLAAGVTIPVTFAYAYIAYLLGEKELCFFALAIGGACAGFLVFNKYPAKVFMGDTGSLALGGGIAALALLTGTELLLIILGGVYVIEAASVILQVTYFKKTGGKRIFRMTPIHHHFELGGWKETKVVTIFTCCSIFFCIIGVALWCLGHGGGY